MARSPYLVTFAAPIGGGAMLTSTGKRWVLLFLPIAGVAHLPIHAQSSPARLSYVLNAAGTNGYHWRGIWRSRAPVIQWDGAAAVTVGHLSLAAGSWANLEPRSARAGHLSDLPLGTSGLSEWDLWAQGSARMRNITLTMGVLQSRYRRRGNDPEVTEAYGSVRVQAGRWGLGGTAWTALDGADGTFIEPAVTFYHFVNPLAGPALALSSTLRAGFQLGHRIPPGTASRTPGPLGTGLTHATLSTQLGVMHWLSRRIALTARSSVAVQWREDRATRLRGDGTRGAHLRFWFPLQLGLSLGQEARP